MQSFLAFAGSPAFPLVALVVVAVVVGCVFYSGFRCGREVGYAETRAWVAKCDAVTEQRDELQERLDEELEPGPAVELPPPVVTAPACPAGIPECTCRPAV
jgi:hypothetical protein